MQESPLMYEVRTVATVLPLNLRHGNENRERERKKDKRGYTDIANGEMSAEKRPGKFSLFGRESPAR